MIGRVNINIARRSANPLRLLWNRLTPTRGMKKVSRQLKLEAVAQPVNITVSEKFLSTDQGIIPESRTLAKNLYNSGINHITLDQDSGSNKIRGLINTLTDHTCKGIINRSDRFGYKIEDPRLSSQDFPLTWTELYDSLATYRGIKSYNMQPLIKLGIFGSIIFAGAANKFLTKQNDFKTGIGLFILGILTTFTLRKVVNLIINPVDRLRYLFPSITFRKDYLTFTEFNKGERLSKLFSMLNQPTRKQIIDYFIDRIDYQGINWIWTNTSIREKELSRHKRMLSLTKEIRQSEDAGFLREMATAPIFILRREAALNPHTPEDALDRLVNQEPYSTVREAVPKNPKIIEMNSRAEVSTNPEELDRLAAKPFICIRLTLATNEYLADKTLLSLLNDSIRTVREAASANPKAPWQIVARELCSLKKEKETHHGIIENPPCEGGAEEYSYTVTGYFSARLKLTKHILDAHPRNRNKIVNEIKKHNRELYRALFPEYTLRNKAIKLLESILGKIGDIFFKRWK
jgi:hypothetical protein